MRIGVLHGPNLNLLGRREPAVYGRRTLAEIDAALRELAAELGAELEIHQANGEGALVTRIQEMAAEVDGFLVNAGGYTHTSVALLDALRGVGLPYVEVHLSNLAARESYRRRSLLAADAVGRISGFGGASYTLALRGLLHHLTGSSRAPDEAAGGA